MRKLIMFLICGFCITAFSAGICMACEATNAAAAQEAGLKYFGALVNGDAEVVFTLVTPKFASEIKDPDDVKYSYLTALLLEYPQTLQVLAAKTSFEFIDTVIFDDWIDVNLEVLAPDMQYIGGLMAPRMPLEDAEMAVEIARIVNEPGLPMEKHKTELEMVQVNGLWKVAAHTDFVGEAVNN